MSVFALPAEILLIILRWAVHIPGELSPTFDSIFSSAEYDFISESTQVKEARETSRVLLQVCKEWYPLARDVLFEYISISNASGLEIVQKELQQTPPEIRRRTRGLQFIVERRFDSIPPPTIRTLMDTLLLLPNLEILRIGGGFDVAMERDLASHFASHLPNLKLFQSNLGSSTVDRRSDDAGRHYLALPGLRYFSGFWATNPDINHLPLIENTNITYLSLTFERNSNLPVQDIKLPSLRTFAAIGLKRTHRSVLGFLDLHGPHITSLCIAFYYNDPSELETEILDRCTSLEEFVRFDLWPMTPIARIYPSIVRFGLLCEGRGVDIGNSNPGYLNTRFHLGRFPNLETVRMLVADYESPPVGCTKEMMEDLLYPRGAIRFEDAYRRLIPDPNAEGVFFLTRSQR